MQLFQISQNFKFCIIKKDNCRTLNNDFVCSIWRSEATDKSWICTMISKLTLLSYFLLHLKSKIHTNLVNSIWFWTQLNRNRIFLVAWLQSFDPNHNSIDQNSSCNDCQIEQNYHQILIMCIVVLNKKNIKNHSQCTISQEQITKI